MTQIKESQRINLYSYQSILLRLITMIQIMGLFNGIGFGQNNQGDVATIQQFTLYSNVLKEDRSLLITCPASENDKNYSVLYLLDGKTNMKLVSGIVDYLAICKIIPEMIIVGIENTVRERDMTPSKSAMFAQSGGAKNFYTFIERELIPYVDHHFPSSSEKILVGHSLGGLFSFASLLENPETFDFYIAISPSIQYNNFEYPPVIANFFKNKKGLTGSLFMSFSDEGNGGAFRRLTALYEEILPFAGSDFTIYCRQYPENNHLTTLIPAISDALTMYYKNKS